MGVVLIKLYLNYQPKHLISEQSLDRFKVAELNEESNKSSWTGIFAINIGFDKIGLFHKSREVFSFHIKEQTKVRSAVLVGCGGGMGGHSSKKSFFPSSLPNALFQNSLDFLIFSTIWSPKLQ